MELTMSEATQEQLTAETQSDGGMLREVVKMSFPIVVANSCRMLMDVSDYAMIARTGDTDASAAILPTQMIMWSFMVLGMGTVSIASTMASQNLGRGRMRACSAYAWQCLYLSVAFWILGAAVWPLLPYVFQWVGINESIAALQSRYAAISVWTIGPTIASVGLSAFFNGIHRPNVTMVVAIEGIIVNAAVSYVLIFGAFGLPAMGLEGAAWGTVVGTNYRATRLTFWLWSSSVHRDFASRETWRFDWTKTINVLRFGGPSGLQWCSDVTVWAVFVSVLVGSHFGKTDQLATNAAWQYLRVSFIPCIGVGMAISAMVGKAIGMRDFDRAIRATRYGVLLMLAFMTACSIIYYIFREEMIALLHDDQPEVIAIGAKVMIFAAVFQIFDVLGIGYNSALRGAGDTFAPSVMFIVAHWVVVIGGGFFVAITYPELGSIGPWIAASVLIIFIGLWLWWRWHIRRWMAIDIFKHDTDDDVVPDELMDEAVSETAV